MCKISIITVTYNADKYIEETIKSVINQSYCDYEYIIIDGASTDNTINIIKQYSQHINYWISEKDNGLYDAMNKGIEKAKGEWIFFINAGDYFVSYNTLETIFKNKKYNDVDIIYGNAIERKKNIDIKRNSKVISPKLPPEYRHGASFVRSEVHKVNKFDLSLTNILEYSLDYQCIYTMFKSGYRFKKIDIEVIIYDSNGISNHPIKNKWYKSLIHNDCKKSLYFYVEFITSIFNTIIRKLINLSTFKSIIA